MTVISVEKDLENLAVDVVAEFKAPVDRVWQLWADPRKLERWWGPPGYPATFEQHSFEPCGDVTYYMTSPEGEKYRGWWQINSVDPPTSIEFRDGFADSEGKPVQDMPVTMVQVTFSELPDGTRMEMHSVYASREALDQVVEMGMLEGIRLAVGQMDELLAA
jgi:uncharacterized protein YndB with AHSA1/START domain